MHDAESKSPKETGNRLAGLFSPLNRVVFILACLYGTLIIYSCSGDGEYILPASEAVRSFRAPSKDVEQCGVGVTAKSASAGLFGCPNDGDLTESGGRVESNEKKKQREYGQRIREVEHAGFSPNGFLLDGWSRPISSCCYQTPCSSTGTETKENRHDE